MKVKIQTHSAPNPVGPYSQGLRVGNHVYVSGQGPQCPETGMIAPTIQEQTRQVLTNICNILEASNASMEDVVKVTAHLADLNDFPIFNQVYQEFFKDPYPVRTTVGSRLKDILVEIDVIAEIECY